MAKQQQTETSEPTDTTSNDCVSKWSSTVREIDMLRFTKYNAGLLTIELVDEDLSREIFRGRCPSTLCEAMSLAFWLGVKQGDRIKSISTRDFIEYLADVMELPDYNWNTSGKPYEQPTPPLSAYEDDISKCDPAFVPDNTES